MELSIILRTIQWFWWKNSWWCDVLCIYGHNICKWRKMQHGDSDGER